MYKNYEPMQRKKSQEETLAINRTLTGRGLGDQKDQIAHPLFLLFLYFSNHPPNTKQKFYLQ